MHSSTQRWTASHCRMSGYGSQTSPFPSGSDSGGFAAAELRDVDGDVKVVCGVWQA